LTFAIYAPVINGQFLWDDDAHVTRPELRSIEGLGRIWFDVGATQQYYPLLHSMFWIEHRAWGNTTTGYHVVNILLHASSAFLLYLILGRLKVPGALTAAVIFAAHPVHVESVAWIAEQKNTLSTVFYLAAMYSYLRFDEERRPVWYAAASSLFVLGLLTKTVVATLAGALLLVVWWQRGRISARRDVLPLAPWFALGAAMGIATASIEARLLGAEGADFTWTFLQRAVLAGRVIWFYLGKLFWPLDLAFVYPRWEIALIWPQAIFTIGVLAVLAACCAVRGRWRAPLAVSLFFVGSLFPVLGFLNVYPFVFSVVADHFQYVASLGIITAVAAAVAALGDRIRPSARLVANVLPIGIVAALATLSWRQCHLYRDPETLYEATLGTNPACYLCLNNLGTIAVEQGRLDKATTRYEDALRVKPNSPETLNNLANLLVERGAFAEAIARYEDSLRIAPNNVIARTNLGLALVRVGRPAEAEAQFEEALRIMPGYAPAAQNLSVLRSLR
jgi:tetratricopeptide (TPR) repeat protein